MASDGRVLDAQSTVLADGALKLLALNGELCLGLAGATDAMHDVLSALGLRSRRSDPVDLLEACQERGCPVDVDYADARDELTNVLCWMGRRAPARIRSLHPPTLLLAGRWEERPVLCEWTARQRPVETADGYATAVAGCLPASGSPGWRAFRRAVDTPRSTAGAERRLGLAVTICAVSLGIAGPVGRLTAMRRLTRGFALSRVEG